MHLHVCIYACIYMTGATEHDWALAYRVSMESGLPWSLTSFIISYVPRAFSIAWRQGGCKSFSCKTCSWHVLWGILCNFFFLLSISCYHHPTIESCFCRLGLVVAKLLLILNPTLMLFLSSPSTIWYGSSWLWKCSVFKDHRINSRPFSLPHKYVLKEDVLYQGSCLKLKISFQIGHILIHPIDLWRIWYRPLPV